MITEEITGSKAEDLCMYSVTNVVLEEKNLVIYLEDGSNIKVTPSYIMRESKLRFFHNIMLPTDHDQIKDLTKTNERDQKNSHT